MDICDFYRCNISAHLDRPSGKHCELLFAVVFHSGADSRIDRKAVEI
jgi:hypothetical protein